MLTEVVTRYEDEVRAGGMAFYTTIFSKVVKVAYDDILPCTSLFAVVAGVLDGSAVRADARCLDDRRDGYSCRRLEAAYVEEAGVAAQAAVTVALVLEPRVTVDRSLAGH